MKIPITSIQTVALMLVLALFPLVHASAQTVNSYDSLHQYNALQSEISFNEITSGDVSQNNDEPVNATATELERIADTEKFSTQQIDNAMSDLEGQSSVQTFLVGTSLGTLKFQLAQTKDQIILLNALKAKTEDASLTTQIDSQVTFLEQEETKVESFVLEQENKFSLFGWFVKIL